jgi:hypothetical protein
MAKRGPNRRQAQGRNLIPTWHSGRGKTHLATVIAKAMQNGYEALSATVATLIDDLRAPAVRCTSATPARPTSNPMSCASTNCYWDAANRFFHVVNDRHVRRRSTLVTTNKHAPQGLGCRAARPRPPTQPHRPARGPLNAHSPLGRSRL